MKEIKKCHRKIVKNDVLQIAHLISTKKLTEKECCQILNIKEMTWNQWKKRNGRDMYFEKLISRMKAEQISNLMERIEKASDTQEIINNGKVIKKPGDWRAASYIVERLSPERFANNANEYANNAVPVINVAIMSEALKRIYDEEPKKITDSKIPRRSQTTSADTEPIDV